MATLAFAVYGPIIIMVVLMVGRATHHGLIHNIQDLSSSIKPLQMSTRSPQANVVAPCLRFTMPPTEGVVSVATIQRLAPIDGYHTGRGDDSDRIIDTSLY